jgi:uncharacterized membrane protein
VRAQYSLVAGQSLECLAPSMSTYVMSFLTLGIFWLGQQAQLNHFGHGTRVLSWIHLGFLCAVSLMPFSTALLAAFITNRSITALIALQIHSVLGLGLPWPARRRTSVAAR